MKRMLLVLACLLAPMLAAGQVTVTGNLKNVGHTNASGNNTYALFSLRNYGANLPKVTGSNVIVSDSQKFTPDSNGNISGTLQGNDTIDPSGTFYQVCIYFQGNQFRCANYLITGSGFDLNSAAPLTTVPAAGTNQLTLHTYPCVVSVAATTWTCQHNFNDQFVLVNVFDSSSKVIVPDTIISSDPNKTIVTFAAPQTGTAILSHAGAVSIATSHPNVVVQNPTGGQTINQSLELTGPINLDGIATCKNFANIRCADRFAGATTQDKVNAAVADFGSIPGFVMVPGNLAANTGNWTLPNNVAVWDHRFTNDMGFLDGALPDQHSHWYLDCHAGANDPYESNLNSGPICLSLNAFADAGGFIGQNGKANLVAAQFGVRRSSGSDRPIWGMDLSTNYASYNNIVTGLEIDLNNTGASDDLAAIGVGTRIISGGIKKTGTALQINSLGPSTNFQNGILVNNYDVLGIELSNQSSSRTADIYILPPADDTAPEILGRNAANTSTTWSIDDSGNIVTKGLIRGALYASPNSKVATSGILRCSSGDSCIAWRNAANSADVPLAKDTSDRLTFNGNTVQTPVYNAAGTILNGAHTVADSGTLSSGTPSTVTITLTGSAAFTSNTTYNCTVTNRTTQANPLKVAYTDGSHFVVTGPNTVSDSFSYICVGN